MAHDQRIGLQTLPGGAGIVPSYRDARQWIIGGMAMRRAVADLLGGAGVYSGGAEVLGDLPDGTSYPPFLGCVFDDGDAAWWLSAAAPTAMEFEAENGECTAYLIPAEMAGVTPAAAVGGLGEFRIIVRLTAAPALAHSLALGNGTVAGSAFTSWAPTGLITPSLAPAAHASTHEVSGDDELDVTGLSGVLADPQTPAAHASSHEDDGDDEIDVTGLSGVLADPQTPAAHGHVLADITDAGSAAALDVAEAGDAASGEVVKGDDSRLTDARTPTAHTHPAADISDASAAGKGLLTAADVAAQRTALGLAVGDSPQFAGFYISGGLARIPRDAKYGPTGTPAANTLMRDLAGAVWEYVGGSWIQMEPGLVPTAGWASFATTGNWNGGSILDGYRVVEPDKRIDWWYHATKGEWRSYEETYPFVLFHPKEMTAPTGGGLAIYQLLFNGSFNYRLRRFYAAFSASNLDASNFWTVTCSDIVDVNKTSSAAIDEAIDYLFNTSTQLNKNLNVGSTGSPGFLRLAPSVWGWKVRK